MKVKTRKSLLFLLVIVSLVVTSCTAKQTTSTTQPPVSKPEETKPVVEETKETKTEESEMAPEKTLAPFSQNLVNLKNIIVDTSQYKKEGPYRIAFASQGPTNTWAAMYDAIARYVAEQNGVEFLYADANGNADKQISDVEDLLAQKPDALILIPLGKAALAAPVEAAMAEGVPVILCGSSVETDNYVSWLGTDSYEQGAASARWLVEKLGGVGNIVTLGGIPGLELTEVSLQAVNDVLSQYPDIKQVAFQYTNYSPTESKAAMDAFIAANPKIDGVFALSGQTAVGVIEAFLSAGKPIPPIAGGQSQNAFLRRAKENNVEFQAFTYTVNQGGYCMEIALKVLRGEPVAKFIDFKELDPKAADFTDAQIDEYYAVGYNDEMYTPNLLPEEVLESFGVKE